MIAPILSLAAVSFVISWVATLVIRRVAVRIQFVDKPGHHKVHREPIALGGGIAIFLAFALPMVAALAVAHWNRDAAYTVTMVGAKTAEAGTQRANEIELQRALHAGALAQTPIAVSFLLGILVLHVMGLVDDRRPLGPYLKLLVQL